MQGGWDAESRGWRGAVRRCVSLERWVGSKSHRFSRVMVRRPGIILRAEGRCGGFLSRGEAVKVRAVRGEALEGLEQSSDTVRLLVQRFPWLSWRVQQLEAGARA